MINRRCINKRGALVGTARLIDQHAKLLASYWASYWLVTGLCYWPRLTGTGLVNKVTGQVLVTGLVTALVKFRCGEHDWH